jgi:hypothetical protein
VCRLAALRPYSECSERRPVALRPILSNGLPFSDFVKREDLRYVLSCYLFALVSVKNSWPLPHGFSLQPFSASRVQIHRALEA